MRRFSVFLLALALTLILPLAACGSASQPQPESASPAPDPPDPPSSQALKPEPEPPASSQPEPVPAPMDNWERILATYYYPTDKLAGQTITDPRGLLPEGGSIDPAGLIETYSTGTSGKEECLALMDRLKAGEKLGDLLQSRGELYAIVTDPAGNEVGDALVKADSLEVMSYGAFPENRDSSDTFRRDCILTGELKAQLEQSGLDLSQTTLTFCIVNNFSNGALFSDGKEECYLLTSESYSNRRGMEVGTLYPVEKLPSLMETCLRDMFPVPNYSWYPLPYEETPYQDTGSTEVPLGLNEFPPVAALCDYLKQNLIEEQYSSIIYGRGKHDLSVQIVVPDMAPVEALLASYPGRMVPVEYWIGPYSKAQLEKAVEDMEAFLAEHPEISYYHPIRHFDNYVPVSLRRESALVTEFIENYPLKEMYRLSVYPDGLPSNPD